MGGVKQAMKKEEKQVIIDKANEAMDTLVRRFTSSNTIEVERTSIKASEFAALLDYINFLSDDATRKLHRQVEGGKV